MEYPHSWAEDPVSQYISAFHQNSVARFVRCPEQFQHLMAIDALFRNAIEHFSGEDDEGGSSFLLRSHAAFLAGTTLTLAGAVSDAPMVLRGSLENALYALHCQRNPEAFSKWCARDQDADAKRKARAEFTVRKVMDTLETVSPGIQSSAKQLYDATIDFGGHPNIGALAQVFEIQASPESRYYGLDYLSGDDAAAHVILKLCAEIGICSLLILGKALPTTFAEQEIEASLKPLADSVVALARSNMSRTSPPYRSQPRGRGCKRPVRVGVGMRP